MDGRHRHIHCTSSRWEHRDFFTSHPFSLALWICFLMCYTFALRARAQVISIFIVALPWMLCLFVHAIVLGVSLFSIGTPGLEQPTVTPGSREMMTCAIDRNNNDIWYYEIIKSAIVFGDILPCVWITRVFGAFSVTHRSKSGKQLSKCGLTFLFLLQTTSSASVPLHFNGHGMANFIICVCKLVVWDPLNLRFNIFFFVILLIFSVCVDAFILAQDGWLNRNWSIWCVWTKRNACKPQYN